MNSEPDDEDDDDFAPDSLNHFPLPGFLNRPAPEPVPTAKPDAAPVVPVTPPPAPSPVSSPAKAPPAPVPQPAPIFTPVSTPPRTAGAKPTGPVQVKPPASAGAPRPDPQARQPGSSPSPSPSSEAPMDPASFDPPSSARTMADVLRRIQPGQSAATAQADAIEALRILTSSTTDLRMPEGNGPDNRLREALIGADPLIRAIGNYGMGMRLLLTAEKKLAPKASEHLLTVAGLAGQLPIPADLRDQLLAVIQLTLGLIQGEESSIEYFKPGLQAPDRGTRAAANYNIANRYYENQPMMAVRHYVETLRLTTNPFTRQRATQWLKDLGYDTQGRPLP